MKVSPRRRPGARTAPSGPTVLSPASGHGTLDFRENECRGVAVNGGRLKPRDGPHGKGSLAVVSLDNSADVDVADHVKASAVPVAGGVEGAVDEGVVLCDGDIPGGDDVHGAG